MLLGISGSISNEYVKLIIANIMKTILVDAFNTFVVDGKIDKKLWRLLETFPNRKIIVTNANDEEQITLGLTNLPYEMYSLSHKPDKVDPQYFKSLLAHFKLEPVDLIYFEHNESAVKSAESVGIMAYHFDKDSRDMKALSDFLNSNL